MGRRVLRWGLGVVLATAATAFAASAWLPASAQPRGSEATLAAADVLPGECRPAVVEPFDRTTCRFPLAKPDGVLDPLRGPYVATYRTPGAVIRSLPCRVEAGELVCRALQATFDTGTFDVAVTFGGRTGDPLAVVAQAEGAAGPITMRAFPPVAVAGWARPIVVEERFGFDRTDAVYLQVREERTDRVVETVEVKPAGGPFGLVIDPETGEEAPGFEYVATTPGPVALGFCVGGAADSCEPTPLRRHVDVVTSAPLELIAGHNVPGADRIDVVIGLVGFEGPDGPVSPVPEAVAVDLAGKLLGLAGPLPLDSLGLETGGPVASLEYGPFAIEPLRSALDRFNLWVLPNPITDPAALSTLFPSLYRDALGLNAVQATVLVSARAGEGLLDEAEATSFDGEMRVPDPATDRFGSVVVYVPEEAPLTAATVLAHEWGHGMFALLDEYVDASGRFTLRFGYPNCAASETEARQWWGDLVGDVDPFFEEWQRDLAAAGLETWPNAEEVRVGLVRGGCYSPGDEAVRPTVDSLMNGIIPVLGGVNRARVETILDSFSGSIDLMAIDTSFASLVGLTCTPDEVRAGGSVRCSGRFPPYVTTSTGELHLLVAGAGRCVVESGGIDEPRGFECGPLGAGSAGGEREVLGSIDGGSAMFPYQPTGTSIVVSVPETTTTTAAVATTTTTEAVGATTTTAPFAGGGGNGVTLPLIVGGGIALVALGALLVMAGRRGRG